MSLPATAPSPAPDRRRQLLAHAVWEGTLLLMAAVAVLLVLTGDDVPLRIFWSTLAPLGLAAMGLALSFRTGTPNIAIGSVGLTSGLVYTQIVNGDGSPLLAAVAAVAVSALVGVVAGVAVGVLTAPAWALTLGVGLLLQAYVYTQIDNQALQLSSNGLSSSSTASILWALVFVVVSVVGGAAWMFADDVRARLSSPRDHAGPGPVDLARVLGAVVGVGGSSLLAGIAGVLTVKATGGVFPGGGDRFTLALAVVLLGGVSVWGRRGGVAGTALAALLLVSINLTLAVHGVSFFASGFVVPAVAVLVGLAVGRVLEAVSGPDVVPVVGVLPHPPTEPDPFVSR